MARYKAAEPPLEHFLEVGGLETEVEGGRKMVEDLLEGQQKSSAA